MSKRRPRPIGFCRKGRCWLAETLGAVQRRFGRTIRLRNRPWALARTSKSSSDATLPFPGRSIGGWLIAALTFFYPLQILRWVRWQAGDIRRVRQPAHRASWPRWLPTTSYVHHVSLLSLESVRGRLAALSLLHVRVACWQAVHHTSPPIPTHPCPAADQSWRKQPFQPPVRLAASTSVECLHFVVLIPSWPFIQFRLGRLTCCGPNRA